MDPYSKTFAGANYDLPAAASESLEPYRDLDPSRLVLHGRGEWDATDFLSDYLVMPYREPRALLSGLEVGPHPAVRDDPQTVAELAKWVFYPQHGFHISDKIIVSLIY